MNKTFINQTITKSDGADDSQLKSKKTQFSLEKSGLSHLTPQKLAIYLAEVVLILRREFSISFYELINMQTELTLQYQEALKKSGPR